VGRARPGGEKRGGEGVGCVAEEVKKSRGEGDQELAGGIGREGPTCRTGGETETKRKIKSRGNNHKTKNAKNVTGSRPKPRSLPDVPTKRIGGKRRGPERGTPATTVREVTRKQRGGEKGQSRQKE